MSPSVQVNIRVPNELVEKLDTIAQATGRKRPDLVHYAIREYVEGELQFIEAVERGREQARAGLGRDLEDVSAELERIIAERRAAR